MYKRLISFVFIFLIVFNIFCYRPKVANAFVLESAVTDFVLESSLIFEGSTTMATMQALSFITGPHLIALTTLGIALGYAYKNREEVYSTALEFYNFCKAKGKDFIDYFTTNTDGSVSISQEGVVDMLNMYTQLNDIDTYATNLLGSITIRNLSGDIAKPTHKYLKIPFKTLNASRYYLKFVANNPYVDLNVSIGGAKMSHSIYTTGVKLILDFDISSFKISRNTFKEQIVAIKNYNKMGKSDYKFDLNSFDGFLNLDFEASISESTTIDIFREFYDSSFGDSSAVEKSSAGTIICPSSIDVSKPLTVDVSSVKTWDDAVSMPQAIALENVTNAKSAETTETPAVGVWDWLKSILADILNAIKDIAKTIINGVVGAFSSILNGIKSLIEGISGILSDVFEAVKPIATTIVDGVCSVLNTTYDGISGILSDVLEGVGSIAGTIVDGLIGTLEGIKEGVGTIAGTIVDALVSPIIGIRDWCLDTFSIGNAEDYKLADIKGLFPFCVPFDMYRILSSLNAEPVAPSIESNIDFGILGQHEINISLEEYNSVAKICRIMMLLLFVVGLIFVVRNYIKW